MCPADNDLFTFLMKHRAITQKHEEPKAITGGELRSKQLFLMLTAQHWGLRLDRKPSVSWGCIPFSLYPSY